MVFSLLFAGATGLVCLMLYNSGVLANHKTKLQNAADAGAYSAALLLARDHNFSAYTNRAMVANQVAVAQLVSLESYLEDAAGTHERMRGTAHQIQSTLVPISKPRWDAGMKAPVEQAYAAYQKMAAFNVQAIDKLIKAFELGQELHHHATAIGVLDVAEEVVQRNDPQASITKGAFSAGATAIQLINWDTKYSKRHRANDTSASADRFADIVVSEESTDRFVRNRTSIPTPGWSTTPTPAACGFITVPINTTYQFFHGGGTILSRNQKRWLALDATMGHGYVTCQVVTPWGTYRVTYPLPADLFGGSGGAVAGANGAYNEFTGYRNNPFWSKFYGDAVINPLTAIPALWRYNSGPGQSLDTAGGLQDYYRDVADPAKRPANQSAALNGGEVPLTIEVEHKAEDIRTSSTVLGNAAATVSLPNAMKGNTMRALSSGHAFFYRPSSNSSAFTKAGWRRIDGKTEMANLFNPYWQAQLVDRTEVQRVLSIGAQ